MKHVHSVLRVCFILLLGLTVLCPAAQLHAQQSYNIEIVPQTGNSDIVESVAFSPNGTHALSGGWDNTLKLWDVATGILLRTFKGHSDDVASVAFSPNGKHALSGSSDSTLKLWDAATGKLIRTFNGHSSGVTSVAFSPNGKHVLSGSWDDTVKLWGVATGTLLRTFAGHSAAVTSVAFSPNGKHVLSGSRDNTVKLWDVATEQVRTFAGHSGAVTSVAFSPTDARVLSGSEDKSVNLWDVAKGNVLRTFAGHSAAVTSVAFSPNGERAISGSSDSTLRLWDVATGKQIRTFKGRSDDVTSVAFSQNGARLLSGDWDNALRLWDVATGKQIHVFRGKSRPIKSVAFSPNGARVLSGSDDKTVKLWDVATGTLLRTFTGHSSVVTSVAYSPNGKHVLSGSWDRTVKLWDAATEQVRTFKGHTDAVSSVAFSPNGKHVLSGSWDNTLKLWDAATGKQIRTLNEHTEWVTSVAFSPNGARVLSGSSDSTLKLWDVATGKLIRTFKGHSNAVNSVAFSQDGARVLSGSADKTLRLWDVATGNQIRTLTGHSDFVQSVAFSPNGARVLSGSDDKSLRLWDVATGKLIRTVIGHSDVVGSVAFSPNGARVLSGSQDNTARLWDVGTDVELVRMIATPDAEWITVTPEGFFYASKNGHKLLSVVRGLNVYSVDQFYDWLWRKDLVRAKLGSDLNTVKKAAAKLNLNVILATGPPPKVKIIAPNNEQPISDNSIKLVVEVASRGKGGIGRIEFRVNGVNKGNLIAGSSGTITVSKELELAAKVNRIEVIAYNKAARIASLPARTTVNVESAVINKQPTLYVFAVGVEDYEDSKYRLNYAVDDVDILTKALEFAGKDKRHYRDVKTTTLKNRAVTSEAIADAFSVLSKEIRAHDVFVFFLSGHGKAINGEYFFVPPDFETAGRSLSDAIIDDGIGEAKWRDWLGNIKAEKSLLIYDTCEAGDLGKILGKSIDADDVASLHLRRATGRALLTASAPSAIALEGYGGHGVLTYSILEALEKADSNNDGFVQLDELFEHVGTAVPAITAMITKNNPNFAEPYRQKPRRLLGDDNYAITKTVSGLIQARASVQTSIPTAPTHVVILQAGLYKQAGGSVTLRMLQPGTLVTLVETKQGWALVAKHGTKIGFVPEEHLLKTQ